MTRHGSFRTRHVSTLVLPALVIAAAACGPKAAPVTTPRPATAAAAPAPAPAAKPVEAERVVPPLPAPRTPVETLRSTFDAIFKAPAFDRLEWAVLIESLSTGETLYSENPVKLMMPASNMKIVTLAAAAERLGWDFTYQTRLVTSARIAGGVLQGDLVVVGSGDPTIGSRGGRSTRVFEEWADALRAGGITAIKGRIVADARAFDRESLGAGWAWDYLASSYAAGVSALQFNESVAEVTIRPGASAGAPAVIGVRPIESGLMLDKQVTTSAGGEADIELARLPGSSRLVVGGSIPAGSGEIVHEATVDRPALYFARMLRSTLVSKGIRVGGIAAEYEDAYPSPPAEATTVLLTHRSEALPEIARVQMKVSQNQYAETLLRTLGAQTGVGTASAGHKVVREVLDGWGVPGDAYVLADGSGLSRYNYLCADTLVRILAHVYRDQRLRDPFVASLPVGGQDGTIAKRFIGTRAAGNVHAKTGSIANVRALSGYVTSLDGETFVFSILANHFNLPQSEIDAATDRAVVALAEFSRSPQR